MDSVRQVDFSDRKNLQTVSHRDFANTLRDNSHRGVIRSPKRNPSEERQIQPPIDHQYLNKIDKIYDKITTFDNKMVKISDKMSELENNLLV